MTAYQHGKRTSIPLLALAGLACVEPGSIADTGTTDTSSTTQVGDGDGDPATGDGDGDPSGDGDGDPSGDGDGDMTGDGDGDMSGDGDGDGDPTGDGDGDMTGDGDGDDPEPSMGLVDVLIVVDNSGTMGEEQLTLGPMFPLLVEQLQQMVNQGGGDIIADVNIMVTTTDMGHPLCSPFEPEGYDPKQGAPEGTACTERLDNFTGLGGNPPSFPEACTDSCPVPVAPDDPFVHFSGPGASTTNVPNDMIGEALGCLGPQGINGCGFESPLESMLQAINPGASWNQGVSPFLREGEGVLAVVFVTDEADCSVRAPNGYAYFTNDDTYWEVNPDTGTKTQATSAVCWNAGVDCGPPDQDGVYADCAAVDTGVLFPITRYLDYLQDQLIEVEGKEVVMLGIVGVPTVTEHDLESPFLPTAGGVDDLVYRQWVDGLFPVGDILPGSNTDAAHKQFEFGIGPGCTGEDGMGGFTGQAIPPARIREVCEALDEPGEARCCLESVCDGDFSPAIQCLTGMIQDQLPSN